MNQALEELGKTWSPYMLSSNNYSYSQNNSLGGNLPKTCNKVKNTIKNRVKI